MTSPIATALTGLLQGYNSGMEERRARERQAMLDKRQADLDAQNRADKDRDFRLRYSEGSLKRAVDTMNAGLIPDNGQLDTADFTGVKPQPGLDAMSGLPDTSQLFQAVSNMRAAPRIGIADESGQTTQYRQGEPVWQKKIRAQQEEERNRILATDAAKEAQKAKDAAAAREAENQQYFQSLAAAFPNHPLVKQGYSPNNAAKYKATFDALNRQADRQAQMSSGGTTQAILGLTGPHGRPATFNGKTNAWGEVPEGYVAQDKTDNPQQLMLGQRGLQGATMMFRGHTAMKKFEEAAKANPALFGGVDQFLSEFNKEIDSGKVTTWHAAEKSAAINALNKTNPALAQYLRAGMQFAFGENEIQQRPSDFRTKMSEFMNSISAGMNPETIDMVSGIREESMLPTLETAQKLRQRFKMSPDAAIDAWVKERRSDGGSSSGAGNDKTITRAEARQLSSADLAALKAKGYKVIP